MKFQAATLGLIAAASVPALVAGSEAEGTDVDLSEQMEVLADRETGRALREGRMTASTVALMFTMQFFNALKDEWETEALEEGRARRGGKNEDNAKPGNAKPDGWVSGMWKSVKRVPGVFYETGSMVAPLAMRYILSEETHPHCEQRMLCEVNHELKTRYGRPGEIAMQLVSTMAGYAISGQDPHRYDSLVDAGRNGRRGKDCSEMYPKCTSRSGSNPMPAVLRIVTKLMSAQQQLQQQQQPAEN